MSFFLSMDLDDCLARNHRFDVVGSDKTPMKRSLMCRTCTDAHPGKSVYVAYGDPLKSWGQWRTKKRREEPIENGELETQ